MYPNNFHSNKWHPLGFSQKIESPLNLGGGDYKDVLGCSMNATYMVSPNNQLDNYNPFNKLPSNITPVNLNSPRNKEMKLNATSLSKLLHDL
jgi:hypothetical protein